MASKIQLITNAKVPIIKMTDKFTDCPLDISFDMMGGPENTQITKALMKEYPESIPLTLFLKYYLKQQNMNEPFSGGVGSYALLSMVISFIQMRKDIINSKESKYAILENITNGKILENNQNIDNYEEIDDDSRLGRLLIEFLDFYGNKFNFFVTGISLKEGGSYFSKVARGWVDEKKPFKMSIEDPHDESNKFFFLYFHIFILTL